MRKIKVLYIIHSTVMGGATISFKNMVAEIQKEGIIPIIVYPLSIRANNDIINYFKRIDCICIPVPMSMSIYPGSSSCVLSFLLLIRKIVIKIFSFVSILIITKYYKPVLIHTNTGVIHEGFLVAKVLHIPHVWHIREYQIKDFGWRIFPSKRMFICFLNSSYTIFISKDLQLFFHLKNNCKSRVIYNPIFSKKEIFEEIEYQKEKYFLVANRLSKEKGIEEIIKAFLDLLDIDSNYRLIIAGAGDEKYIEYLNSFAKNTSYSSKISFLGYVADIKNLMRHATALVVGSFYEAFGRMTAEANMLGCLVIGRNTGGTKEILQETGGGLLFLNKKDLIECFLEIIGYDKKEYLIKAKKSQNNAITLFSTENNVISIMDFYSTIINGEI